MAFDPIGWLLGYGNKGVHPPYNKVTSDKAIKPAKLPKEVVIPLSQHIGAPAKAVVKKRAEVKTGEVLAEAGGYVSAPMHATISGKVSNITQMIHTITGRPMDAIVIESDGEDKWTELKPVKSLSSLSNEDILKRIWDGGLVGMGGATFPTHVKLKPPEDKKIDTLIINGAECEPWITSDHRMMLEHGKSIISGIEVMDRALPTDHIIIAVEDNKPDAIAKLNGHVKRSKIRDKLEVRALRSQYPMGGEKTLTKVCLGREVPIGGLPLDIGVVVQNVSTVKAIHDAVIEGQPLIERAMTITGMVKKPRNLLVRFGTPIGHLLDQCGGIQGNADQVIFGGPMMGLSQYSLTSPVIKGTNCILVKELDRSKEQDCIRCGKCIDHCPMDLMPTQYVAFAKYKKWEEAGEYYIDDCIECGSCSYSCPAKIPIVQYIKLAKAELGKLRRKA